MPETRSVAAFVTALGSSAPAPGGGAAAALAGALAAALAEMVAQLTVGKPRYATVEERMRALLAEAQTLRDDLLALIEADEQAFGRVAAAYRLPKGNEEERAARDEAIQAALRGAMQPPLGVMRRACDALELAGAVAALGNPSVASDAGCAAILGEAAVRAGGLNVLANVVLLDDEFAAAETQAALAALEARAQSLRDRALATVAARMKRG